MMGTGWLWVIAVLFILNYTLFIIYQPLKEIKHAGI